MGNTEEKKTPKWKTWVKYTYLTALHILAGVAAFLILTALAVKFKWTNDAGDVDINNRYYEDIASQYGNESKKDSATIARDEYIMFQRLGVLSRYYPHNAKVISEAYQHEKNVYTALRMLDAVSILLRDNKQFMREMKEVNKKAKFNSGSVYAWSNYTVWKQFCNTIIKDKRAIDSVSRLTGVESRIIVMCVVGEQLRMFNSGREKFKQYVYPYSRLILPSNRGYGVSGILEHTAIRIESTLFNEKDPFYPGDYFQQTINVRDSFPEVINDSISAHKHKTIQRLIKGGDHYYSYLYTAFLMRQFQAHWERNGFDLSNRPEILGTLFNLGYQKSKPKKNPEVGGSTFKIGEKDYTFGGLCFEFYYSGEMQDAFPITGRGFIPVKELEKNNKTWIEAIKKRIEEEEKARLEAEKAEGTAVK
ncbi:MAG: hypothetical protein RLZZ198_2134 [Bacteroidota bacterium]|jgi:hypothetical protein